MRDATPEEIVKMSLLQEQMDNLTRARRRAIAEYDRSGDGSPEKRNALAKLAELGRLIVEVEQKLGAIVDEMLMPEGP